MKEAILYKKIKKDLIQCLACNHYCLIKEGKVGICGIRLNKENKLYLLTYGKPAAINIDPMEKKPLFHFLPGSQIFSFGTIGCNFSCGFCQNWDISQISKISNSQFLDLEKIGENWPPEKIIDYVLKEKIPAIAYTYSEPTVFFEYAYDTAKLAKQKGIKNVFVSNGYLSKEAIAHIKSYLDAINVDLKAFSEEFYNKICKARLKPVLESIKRIYDAGIWLEITTLIVPNENDSEEELSKIAEFIASIDKNIPWHISRFFPQYKMGDKEITSFEKLKKAYQIGKDVGLNYVYIGNVIEENFESTFCPKCKTLLIKRAGYEIENKNLDFKKGRCKICNQTIKGIWQ